MELILTHPLPICFLISTKHMLNDHMLRTCEQPSEYGDTEGGAKEGKLVACLGPSMAAPPCLYPHSHLGHVAGSTCWEHHKETVGKRGREGVRKGGRKRGKEGGVREEGRKRGRREEERERMESVCKGSRKIVGRV